MHPAPPRAQPSHLTAVLRRVALSACALLGIAPLVGQEPRPSDDEAPRASLVREIVTQNLAPFPRQEWVRVTVPLAPGVVTPDDPLPDLHVADHATLWQPFGGTWPDGSLRFASCMFRPILAAGTTARFALVRGRGPEVTALGEEPRRPPPFEIVVEARVDGGDPEEAVLSFSRMLESGPRQVAVMEQRIGDTGLVAQASLELLPDQDHGTFGIGVFFSDPRTEKMQVHVDLLQVHTRGVALVLRHAGRHGCTFEHGKEGTTATLLRDRTLADGQGLRRNGVLLPPADPDATGEAAMLHQTTLRAAAAVPVLAAVDWRGTDAYGPYGFVPDPPPWVLASGGPEAALARRHARFQAESARLSGGDPLAAPALGLAKNPGQTGDQNDFGLVKLEQVAATGIGSFLLEVEASVLQEGCRPTHFFEADGSPVLSANHPDWVVWSGRTHWHCAQSKDRLGKPCPEPRHDRQGWGGKDRQHWSSNYLVSFALLTRDPQIQLEIDNEIQLYLAGQTVRDGVSTSGAGAPRGAGRVMHTACWLWLVDGDPALLARMRERIEKVYWPQWHGREFSDDRVRPMSVSGADARLLEGKYPFWNPWQDSIAACGFEAFARITGGRGPGAEKARELSRSLARNALRHGWFVDGSGRAVIATAIRWKHGGEPLTDAERADGILWSYGTAFSEWSIGALEIARVDAKERGDAKDLAHAEDLLRRIRAGRRPPPDGWWDRFAEWDGLRFPERR
jgi:hypothetical protein